MQYLTILMEYLSISDIVIGNRVVRMGDSSDAGASAAGPGADTGASGADGTIVRGQQFLVAPR